MRAPFDTLAMRGLSLAVLLTLAACGTTPHKPASNNVPLPSGGKVKSPVRQDPTLPALPAAGSGRGGYYKDDGPGDNPPANLRDVPDAEVRNEPYSTRSNRPYVVFGKTYTPITDNEPFKQKGTGTWYGKKFHGQRTSSGEIYDMYKMTAAHPTLPIPSYARVTSIDSGEQVIVRINDRGPFHATRVIDVSYTAALKLGFLGKGSHQVVVERLLPADIDAILAARAAPKAGAFRGGHLHRYAGGNGRRGAAGSVVADVARRCDGGRAGAGGAGQRLLFAAGRLLARRQCGNGAYAPGAIRGGPGYAWGGADR